MKKLLLGFCLLTFLTILQCMLQADEKGWITKSMINPDFVWKRIHIKWGIQTKSRQIWDGHAEIDSGYILKVKPFIRRDLLDDSKLVTETSWKSETYTDVEGIFLTIYAPPSARIRIVTKTHAFSFTIKDIETRKKLFELDGDIEIEDQTEDVLFRIQGLEYGKPGSGSVTISPTTAFVDSFDTFTITFTVGKESIPVGGGIRVSWHFTRSWGKPQFTDPTAPNFVTVKTNGEAQLDYQSEHRGLFEYPFTQGRILVRVFEKPLKPGEQIVIVLGDTSGGSRGFQTPVVSEKDFTFRVESCTEVPESDFPVYRRLKELPTLEIKTLLKAKRFFTFAPSSVVPNEPFSLKVVVEDKYRNVAEYYTGSINVSAESNGVKETFGTFSLTDQHNGILEIKDLKLPVEGVWKIRIQGSDGVSGESNPVLCEANNDGIRLYWGELHGHTRYSDGYGSADDYFNFARTRAAIDFAAITDHDVELDAPDYKVSKMWKEVKEAVGKWHDPPNFITLLAYEWSPARITETTKYPYGDHNVFYFQKKGYLFPTGDQRSNTLQKLYQRLKELPLETLVKVIPHVGGAIGNWEIHDPELEPLGEIYSVHGSFEQFGQIALDKGYRIGFVGAADAHNGQIGGFPPGNSANHFVHGGLTGVYASELSRKALYEAVSKRRVFATTGKRIIVDFSIDGYKMGEEITATAAPRIKASAIGEKPIWKIELIKNGKVVYSRFNSVLDSNVVTILWRNRVERDDLLAFDKGLWSRRLRGVSWYGKLESPQGRLRLLSTCSFDFPKDNIFSADGDSILWRTETRGDYDGIRVQVNNPEASLSLSIMAREFSTVASARGFLRSGEVALKTKTFTFVPAGLSDKGTGFQVGPSDFVTIIRGEPSDSPVALDFVDTGLLHLDNYYYVRVTQIDGEMAWSSPIWVSLPSPEE